MRNAILLLLAATLSVASGNAGARGPRHATLEYEFTDQNVSVSTPATGAFYADTSQLYEFELRKGERFVSVAIADSGDGPISGWATQRVTDMYQPAGGGGAGTGHSVTHYEFCGETPQPVEVKPNITVTVSVNEGTCEDGTPSMPSSGRIIVDFYRR